MIVLTILFFFKKLTEVSLITTEKKNLDSHSAITMLGHEEERKEFQQKTCRMFKSICLINLIQRQQKTRLKLWNEKLSRIFISIRKTNSEVLSKPMMTETVRVSNFLSQGHSYMIWMIQRFESQFSSAKWLWVTLENRTSQ